MLFVSDYLFVLCSKLGRFICDSNTYSYGFSLTYGTEVDGGMKILHLKYDILYINHMIS